MTNTLIQSDDTGSKMAMRLSVVWVSSFFPKKPRGGLPTNQPINRGVFNGSYKVDGSRPCFQQNANPQ